MTPPSRVSAPRDTYDDIDAYEALRRIEDGATVIDVREPSEYAQGHVPGALLLPLGEVGARAEEIPDGAVLVCATGNRSGRACAWLAQQGKTGLANLAEGTQGWIQHGLSVE